MSPRRPIRSLRTARGRAESADAALGIDPLVAAYQRRRMSSLPPELRALGHRIAGRLATWLTTDVAGEKRYASYALSTGGLYAGCWTPEARDTPAGLVEALDMRAVVNGKSADYLGLTPAPNEPAIWAPASRVPSLYQALAEAGVSVSMDVGGTELHVVIGGREVQA